MRVARNITKTPSGRYRVRVAREYLDNRESSYHLTLSDAVAARDQLEAINPIRSPHYNAKKPRCPHCGK